MHILRPMGRGLVMNSRQRRKLAADLHNLRIDEAEAYKQDRIEDPLKHGEPPFDKLTDAELRALILSGQTIRVVRRSSND